MQSSAHLIVADVPQVRLALCDGRDGQGGCLVWVLQNGALLQVAGGTCRAMPSSDV